jgi:hypothetical protein
VTIESLKRHRELRPFFPQKLLFSATLSQNPEKLEEMNLFMPRLFTSSGVDAAKKEDAVGAIEYRLDAKRGRFLMSATPA